MKLTFLLIFAPLGVLVSGTLALHTAECTNVVGKHVPYHYGTNPHKWAAMYDLYRGNLKNSAIYVHKVTRECCARYEVPNSVVFSETSGKCEISSDASPGIDMEDFILCCQYKNLATQEAVTA